MYKVKMFENSDEKEINVWMNDMRIKEGYTGDKFRVMQIERSQNYHGYPVIIVLYTLGDVN